VRAELRDQLLAFEDPDTGSRPIADVIFREDLYEGPYLDLAPDLFVRAQDLWSMSAGSKGSGLTSPMSWPTGRHRRTGIVVAHGDRVLPGDLGTRSLADIAPTALAFCGVHVDGLDGRPIEEVSGAHGRLASLQARSRADGSSEELSVEEQDQITNHLRDLGYIE
jgi:predicted AlkP superfamily phosphohydrolase/phosphomutase